MFFVHLYKFVCFIEFYEDLDVDSEYSPVCSDIEDETLATNGDSASTSSNIGTQTATTSHSSEIMRLLDECSRVESVIDDAQVSDDEEMNIGLCFIYQIFKIGTIV